MGVVVWVMIVLKVAMIENMTVRFGEIMNAFSKIRTFSQQVKMGMNPSNKKRFPPDSLGVGISTTLSVSI